MTMIFFTNQRPRKCHMTYRKTYRKTDIYTSWLYDDQCPPGSGSKNWNSKTNYVPFSLWINMCVVECGFWYPESFLITFWWYLDPFILSDSDVLSGWNIRSLSDTDIKICGYYVCGMGVGCAELRGFDFFSWRIEKNIYLKNWFIWNDQM